MAKGRSGGSSRQRKMFGKHVAKEVERVLGGMGMLPAPPIITSAVAEQPKQTRRESLAWAFTFAGLAVAFSSWGYTVVAPEPNVYFGSALFLAAVLFFIAGWWIYVQWTNKVKLLCAAIVFTSFLIADRRIFISYSAKKMEGQQADVYRHLDVRPGMPSERKIFRTGVIVVNGGGTQIKEYAVQCRVRRIVMSPAGGVSNAPMQTTLPEKAGLEPYGDGDTSYCFAGIQEFPGVPICADVTVDVSYSLSTQPSLKKVKPFRFVAQGDDFAWLPRPVGYAGDYCPAPRVP